MKDPGHLGFDYRIHFSQRRTIGLVVRGGEVHLRAPIQVSLEDVQQWLYQKAGWVNGKLLQQAERQAQVPIRQYQPGEQWPLLGQALTLEIEEAPGRSAVRARQRDRHLVVSLPATPDAREDRVRLAIETWYRDQAREILSRRSHVLCDQLGVQASAIRLRRTRTKWGHCTHDGVLQYNWLIIQAPEAVVDYLVTHECCHLVYMNHSRAYWQLVEKMMPGYAEQRRWLREKGHTLVT